MKTTFRWYGKGNDTISLADIRQIPSMHSVVWALHDLNPGVVWPVERIQEVKDQAAEYNLGIDVVESVNIHESIKLGTPDRDEYIENYKQTLINLGKVGGIKVVCYNFMPVFDWVRTNMAQELEDGSTALFYENAKIEGADPYELIETVKASSRGMTLPGWEPERLAKIEELFKAYENVTEDDLFENLAYFLKEIVPVAEENGIKMAIHPDDPPYPVFGLPRIVRSKENLQRIIDIIDSPSNGLTLCSGALGSNPKNDIPDMIRTFKDRIPFAHIRNVKIYDNGDFIETSHREQDGSVPILEIMKAYHEIGFDGYMRPDHGRHLWGEESRPGYGLYDRALGIMYMMGAWDLLDKLKNESRENGSSE